MTTKAHSEGMPAREALRALMEGNTAFAEGRVHKGDVSPTRRHHTAKNGQEPFAIVITCSDSRVIPEAIFNVGIGDLFVIRVAGNVLDNHQLGSIEYAASHLGTNLVVMLGHTHCGAVDAAINHDPEGYIKYITDEIADAIGDERDPYEACLLNVKHGVDIIEQSFSIQRDEAEGLQVVGAVYDIETGRVKIV